MRLSIYLLMVIGCSSSSSSPTPDSDQRVKTTLPTGTVSVSGDCAPKANEPAVPSDNVADCVRLTVQCEDLSPIDVRVAMGNPTGPSQGLVVLSSGSGGGGFYGSNASTSSLVAGLIDQGYQVFQRAWSPNWFFTETGSDGFAQRSCRYALLLDYLVKEYSSPSLPACISGQSGGSAEITYATTHWGLADIVTLVVPTAGPMTSAAMTCFADTPRGQTLLDECWAQHDRLKSHNPATTCTTADWKCFHDGIANYVNASHGSEVDMPCELTNPGAEVFDALVSDSPVAANVQRYFDTTKWRFIIGDSECGILAAGASSISADLADAGTNATLQLVPGVRHGVPNSADGAAAIENAILADCH